MEAKDRPLATFVSVKTVRREKLLYRGQTITGELTVENSASGSTERFDEIYTVQKDRLAEFVFRNLCAAMDYIDEQLDGKGKADGLK